MANEIPSITYQSKFLEIEGIEIIRLEHIASRKDTFLDHHPERPHQIGFYQLTFYSSGVTEQLVDFKWYKVKENTLVYLSKGQVNAFKFNDDVKGFVILFTEDYFKNRLNDIPDDTIIRLFTSHLFSPKVQIPDHSSIIQYIQLLFDEFYNVVDNFNKKNIIDALYVILFSKIEAIKKDQTLRLKDSDKLILFLNFQALLKEHYQKSRNADFYANKMHITYKHLNVVCKEIVQKTAKQYIDEFIILEAKRHLLNSNIKSTQLGYLMGFEESTNFVKYFKKHTGLTPNSFKNDHLNKL